VMEGHLAPGGSAVLQVGPDQVAPVTALAATYAGLRVVQAREFDRGALVRVDRST